MLGHEITEVVVVELEVLVGLRRGELGEVLIIEHVLVPIDGLLYRSGEINYLFQYHVSQGLIDDLDVFERTIFPAFHQQIPSVHHKNGQILKVVIVKMLDLLPVL